MIGKFGLIIPVIFIYQLCYSRVRRFFKCFFYSYHANTSVRIFNQMAGDFIASGIHQGIGINQFIFKQSHVGCNLKGRTRILVTGNGVIKLFFILTFGNFRKISDGSYFTGCHFHQYHATMIGITGN